MGWGLSRYLFGGDYNPEQWPPSVRAQDLELMRQARVNLVTVGVFSWSLLQPTPAQFDFAWLDETLAALHEAGIGVALATPTAAPPPWFTLAYPEALPQTREGVRLVHGSRDTYCINAPAYRNACLEVASQLAARYATHPALRMWHVHNEYGTWCFCDHCAVAFRSWLQLRYSASLPALNDAWSTTFWSQRYGSWQEILPPRATQYLRNPAQELDYRRFLSASMLDAFREQRDIIRAGGGSAPITTNFVLGPWVPVDHAAWAREVDLVAIDHYPSTVDNALAESGFAADAARGWAGGGDWLLMEHPPRDSDLMERIALSHLERGSIGALFFQWRASRGGAEQWHPALVPHGGPDTAMFRRTVALGSLIASLTPAARPRAEIALWYDELCSWALQATHDLPVKLDYGAEMLRCHSTLESAGHRVDVIPPGAALDPYRVLIVPCAYMLSDSSVEALRAFEGRLIAGEWSGTVDEHLRVRPAPPLPTAPLTPDLLASVTS
jgi:beta-galactosidase